MRRLTPVSCSRSRVGLGLLLLWHVLTVYPILGADAADPVLLLDARSTCSRGSSRNSPRARSGGTSGSPSSRRCSPSLIGAAGGILFGFLFARRELLAAVFDPYIKAANALPRVVLAPIFALWFGLGIWSKVALGFTLVFFIVFFNVYQGVREVSPVVLANARMLGMNERQLLRHVYWPSALTWMFSSLHTSVGFALVGAVVGEYLGSSAGLGYKIHEAESVFDVTGVFAGMLILSVFVIVIDAVVTAIENRLLVWRPGPSTTAQTLSNPSATLAKNRENAMERRTFLIGTGAAVLARACAPRARAQGKRREGPRSRSGVGGKPLLYYLPLTVAERKGFFKEQGLDVEINDFGGGAKSLQALIGGSVDVVTGAYEHTIRMQAKGQDIRRRDRARPLPGDRARRQEGQGRARSSRRPTSRA